MWIMAITSAKGGVGKSTVAANIAASFALTGTRTLVIDLDPQGALAHLLGMAHPLAHTALEQLHGRRDPQLIEHPQLEHLRAMSADPLKDSLHDAPSPGALRALLNEHQWQPQLVILDLAPSLEPVTCWALNEANSAMVVLGAQAMSVRTVPGLLRHLLNHTDETLIEGILLNLYGADSELGQQVHDAIDQTFRQWLLPTTIPSDVSIQRAALQGQPLCLAAPATAASMAIDDLVEHLCQKHPSLRDVNARSHARQAERA